MSVIMRLRRGDGISEDLVDLKEDLETGILGSAGLTVPALDRPRLALQDSDAVPVEPLVASVAPCKCRKGRKLQRRKSAPLLSPPLFSIRTIHTRRKTRIPITN